MGKATIISSDGSGKYTIALNYAREKLDGLLAEIASELATISVEIVGLRAAEAAAAAGIVQSRLDLDIAISFYAADPTAGNKKAVETHTKAVNRAQREYQQDVKTTATMELREASLIRREVLLRDAIPDTDPEVEAWCVDHNLAIEGEVGTIDVGRWNDLSVPQLIKPAGADGDMAVYTPETDGQLLPITLMTPESAYNSYALLPGANKWKPRYRKGGILATDGTTCTVRLDTLSTTHQTLDNNQTEEVTADFQYMNCNGTLFVVGDRVVVAFLTFDWEQGTVIGFDKNPRPCFFGFAFATQVAANEIRTAQYMSGNPPWAVTEYTFGGGPLYGNIDWRGEDGEILSFKGYNRYMGFVSKFPEVLSNSDRLDIYIYKDGKIIVTASEKVSGVCMSGGKLFYVTHSFYGGDKFYFADLDDLKNPRLVHTEPNFYQDSFPVGPWLIDAKGVNGTTRRLSSDGVQINRYHLYISATIESVTVTDKGQNDWTTGEAESFNYSKMELEDFDGNKLVTGSIEVIGEATDIGGTAYNDMLDGMRADPQVEPPIGSSGVVEFEHKSRTVIIMDSSVLADEILHHEHFTRSWTISESDIAVYDWVADFVHTESEKVKSKHVIKWMDLRGPFLALDTYTEIWDPSTWDFYLSDSRSSSSAEYDVKQGSSTYYKSIVVSPNHNKHIETYYFSNVFNVDKGASWLSKLVYPYQYNWADISRYPSAHGEPPIVYSELSFRQVVVYEKYGNATWYRDDKSKIMFSFVSARQIASAISNRQMFDIGALAPVSNYEHDEYITDADFETLIPIKGKSHIGVI